MSTNSKIITFLDTVGRTILGEVVPEQSNDSVLAVKNAVVLHVVPQDQQGRMSVQLLPLFFREFLAEKTADVVFFYRESSITKTDIETLDFRLKSQYEQMFNSGNIFVPPSAGGITPATSQPGGGNPVVNLFDE